MSEFVSLYVTAPSQEVAANIGRAVVDERLALAAGGGLLECFVVIREPFNQAAHQALRLEMGDVFDDVRNVDHGIAAQDTETKVVEEQ